MSKETKDKRVISPLKLPKSIRDKLTTRSSKRL